MLQHVLLRDNLALVCSCCLFSSNNFCCVHHVITYQHEALQIQEVLEQKAFQ